nr:inorganic phosphate transporter [Rhodospirillales bacterium]
MTKKTSLDKDLKRIVQLERATATVGKNNINLAISILFLIGVVIFATFQNNGSENNTLLIVAAVIGGYMALNIGANDVANNVGPAVGSKAITLFGALIIATIF